MRSECMSEYNYKEDVFFNPVETTRGFTWDVFVKTFKEYLKENPNRDPQVELPLIKQDSLQLEQTKNESKLIWFGHSAFLLQLDGKNILLDPMLGEAPSPVKWLSRKRYSKVLPLAIAELPKIDFVFISHISVYCFVQVYISYSVSFFQVYTSYTKRIKIHNVS